MIGDAGLEHAGDGDGLVLGVEPVAGDARHEHRQAVAETDAETQREEPPEQDAAGAGLERVERAALHEPGHVRHGRLRGRIDAAHEGGTHLGPGHEHALQAHVRRAALDAAHVRDALAHGAGIREHAVGGRDRDVLAHAEQAPPELALEAVHDRQDDDQRRDAERDAGQRREAHERHEAAAPARGQVTQPDVARKRPEHGRQLNHTPAGRRPPRLGRCRTPTFVTPARRRAPPRQGTRAHVAKVGVRHLRKL